MINVNLPRVTSQRPSEPAVQQTASPGGAAGPAPQLDTFQAVKGPVDRSAAAAMARLERTSGPISGEELRKAILAGIKDKDAHGASSELSTIQAWGARQGARLTRDAKEVLAAYAKVGAAARRGGHTGLNESQVKRLQSAMAEAARPADPKQPKPPPGKDNHLAYALEHPNAFFKRQAYSARFNSRPDELRNGKVVFASSSGNCGPTSLAMAVKAFGLEQARVAKNPEDSIDLARNAMTRPDGQWNTLREPADNHDGVVNKEVLRGARRLGLHARPLPINNGNRLKALDQAFAEGRMVILGGQPGQPGTGHTLYEKAMRERSGKTDYSYDKGHCTLVMGKDAQGRYLVADPLSRNGVVHMTAREMASFEQWFGAEVSR